MRHESSDANFLNFNTGASIRILSKSAGSQSQLWGGEVDGKHGYFPSHFVKEYRVYVQDPSHIVSTNVS